MVSPVEIKPNEDFSASYEIRKTVFVEEQNIPIENEMDGLDSECFHIVLYEDAAPIGSGRLYIHDDIARLGRVAVLKDKRGKGYASVICNALIDIARREGAKVATLDSQAYVASLYEKMGFIRDGDEFLEEGILHIKMNMQLI
ncbi:MAG: GNAT family N-acetyltransferase [Clostridiales bacterium]|nr:GNAT family N-acetyltransferase [Clostridiales bacterium]